MKPPDLFESNWTFWLRFRLFRLSQWVRVYFGPRISPDELAKFLVWEATNIPRTTVQSDNELILWEDELVLMRIFTVDLALRFSIQAAETKKRAENLEAVQREYTVALLKFFDPHPLREEFLGMMHSRLRSYDEAVNKDTPSGVEFAVAAKLISFIDGDSNDPDMSKITTAMKEVKSIFDVTRYTAATVRFKS